MTELSMHLAHDPEADRPWPTLDELTQRIAQDGEVAEATLDDWVGQISQWASLDEYLEQLGQRSSLWLPTTDEKEIQVLLGLALLGQALDCSPSQLTRKLTRYSVPVQMLPDLVSPEAEIHVQTQALSSKTDLPVEAEPALTKSSQNELLLEQLTLWQATFELALEEAGQQLDPESFPASQLEEYFATMCNILRAAL